MTLFQLFFRDWCGFVTDPFLINLAENSLFIMSNVEGIVTEWESFARTVLPEKQFDGAEDEWEVTKDVLTDTRSRGDNADVGIKSFSDIKDFRTMNELSAAQRALLQDIASGEVNDCEARPIQNELNALQKKWQKQAHDASTPADFEALTMIWGYKR